MKISFLRLFPLLLFAALILFFWQGLSLKPQQLPAAKIGQKLPDFTLPILRTADKYLTAKQLQGQISLLNVWASWCEACKLEQDFLMQLKAQNIPIYGLNYKDNTEDAVAWLTAWGIPYQSIGVDVTGKTAIDLGVYGTPETFLLDKNGVIQYRHIGILDEQSWQVEFLPRMRQLEKKV